MQKFFLIGALPIASLIASCGFGSDAALSSDQTERRSDGLVYDINFSFRNLGNTIDSKLCFGIHFNHPLQPLNIE